MSVQRGMNATSVPPEYPIPSFTSIAFSCVSHIKRTVICSGYVRRPWWVLGHEPRFQSAMSSVECVFHLGNRSCIEMH